MNAERWREVNRVFNSARELASARKLTDDQREAFLLSACGGDEEVLSSVRRMLLQDDDTGMLDHPLAPRPSAPHSFAAGRVVAGRYRIIRYISAGGMGEVYEAHDLELNERVALKTLLPGIARDGRMISRFKQEIQLARKVAHPNVCRVFDLARDPLEGSADETVYFLTMELLAGETLSSRLNREGRLDTGGALPLLRQMAAGLDAAHAAGVIHRDFKTSNVMVTPGPQGTRVVVTDFGLARSFVPSPEITATASGQLMGTLDYMAPELLSGGTATAASDLYALGIVAYRMLAGELPFTGGNPFSAALRRMQLPAPSPREKIPDLDPRWDAAIRLALSPDPALRFASGAEFVRALEGETVWTLPMPAPVLAGMPRRRIAVAACLLAASVAVWAGWNAWTRWRNQPPAEAAGLFRKGLDDIHAGAYFAATKALAQATKTAPHFSLAHARLAEAWVSLDVPEKAGREMLLARREDNAGLSPLDRLQMEAVDLTITRDFTQAAAKYEEMRKLAGPAEAPDIDVDLGRAYESAGQSAKAMECYRRAVAAPGQHPAAWLRLASGFVQAADRVKKLEAFDQAEQLYHLTSNLEGLTQVAYERGRDANRTGHPEEAVPQLTKALETAKLAGNLQQEIQARLLLSNSAYMTGNATQAESLAREALATAQANQMEALAIRGLMNVAAARTRQRDYEGARKYYDEALTLAKRTGALRLQAQVLLSFAVLDDQFKRAELAAQEARQSLDYWERNNFFRESISCLVIIGRFQRNRGEYDQALATFQRVNAMAEKSNDAFGLGLAHESLGVLLMSQERFPEALPHLQATLESRTEPERGAYAAVDIAETLWQLGRYTEARRMYATASEKADKFPALRFLVDRSMAEMEVSEGRFAEAAAVCRRLLPVAPTDRDLEDVTRILGLALLGQGKTGEGLKNCERAAEMAEKLGDVSTLAIARLAVARARAKAGDVDGTVATIRLAEPALGGMPATKLIFLALGARLGGPASQQFIPEARRQLVEIQKKWGQPAFDLYAARPDLQELLVALSVPASANR